MRRRRHGLLGFDVFLIVLAAPLVAEAQVSFPPIVNRNFNIDLFEQPALGSPRLIAMSGAIDAVAEGAAGLYTNPASPAVRPETTADKLAWNVYFNSYVAADGQDSNDNGQLVTDVHRSLLGAVGTARAVWPVGLHYRWRLHRARDCGSGRGWPGCSIAHRSHRRGADILRSSCRRGHRSANRGTRCVQAGNQQPDALHAPRGVARRGRRLDAEGERLSPGRQRRSPVQHRAHPVQLRSEQLRGLHLADRCDRAVGRDLWWGVALWPDTLERQGAW